jgi:hypothetical protein
MQPLHEREQVIYGSKPSDFTLNLYHPDLILHLWEQVSQCLHLGFKLGGLQVATAGGLIKLCHKCVTYIQKRLKEKTSRTFDNVCLVARS